MKCMAVMFSMFLVSSALAGPTTRPSRIVFVCDATGSMVSKFSQARRVIQKAITDLDSSQKFNIIFYQSFEMPHLDTVMVTANDDAKLRAAKFLETITPRAETDPLPALKMALDEWPTVIYLLTDCDFGKPDIAAKIRKLNQNPKHPAIINVIGFNDDSACIKTMKEIAKDGHGTFENAMN